MCYCLFTEFPAIQVDIFEVFKGFWPPPVFETMFCEMWWSSAVQRESVQPDGLVGLKSVTRSFSFLVLCLRPLFLIWKTWVRSWPVPLMWTWMWWKSTAEQEHTVPAVMEQRFLPPPFSSFSLLIFTLESTSSRRDTNSVCPLRLRALCLPGSFYSSSFVALRDRICIATAITPVCGCERGWSPVFTFLLITVYSGKAAERLTFALRSLSATVWPPSNKRGFASSKMLRLWIRPHADHFHEFSYICLNCVSFL